jgi:hypothetical protein
VVAVELCLTTPSPLYSLSLTALYRLTYLTSLGLVPSFLSPSSREVTRFQTASLTSITTQQVLSPSAFMLDANGMEVHVGVMQDQSKYVAHQASPIRVVIRKEALESQYSMYDLFPNAGGYGA